MTADVTPDGNWEMVSGYDFVTTGRVKVTGRAVLYRRRYDDQTLPAYAARFALGPVPAGTVHAEYIATSSGYIAEGIKRAARGLLPAVARCTLTYDHRDLGAPIGIPGAGADAGKGAVCWTVRTIKHGDMCNCKKCWDAAHR